MESTLILHNPISNNQGFSLEEYKPSFEYVLDLNLMKTTDKPKRAINITEASRTKRIQVKNACVNCQKACKKCDDGRPCQRCIKYDIIDTCRNSVRKTRKKGVKRGSHRRKLMEKSKPTTSISKDISAVSGEEKETVKEDLYSLTFTSLELQQQTIMGQLPYGQDVSNCYSALPNSLECYTTSKNETNATSYITSSLVIPHEEQTDTAYTFYFSSKNQIVPLNALDQSSLNLSTGIHQNDDDMSNFSIGQKM